MKTQRRCSQVAYQNRQKYESLSFCSCSTCCIQRPCDSLVSKNRCKFPRRYPRWLKTTTVSLSKETLSNGDEPPNLQHFPYSGNVTNGLDIKDAMSFFRLRQGHWHSWRVSHHLAFRREEQGKSNIFMQVLEKDDPRIVALCQAHQVDPLLAAGGCYVEWAAQLSWDQEGENHEGSTVFAVIPDSSDGCSGQLLRDRGYAEIVQVAGTFRLTPTKELVLHTPYDGGDVEETFSFVDKDTVIRSSTVKRFGGFSTATFSTERRKNVENVKDSIVFTEEMMPFGGPSMAPKEENKETFHHRSPKIWNASSSTGALDFQ